MPMAWLARASRAEAVDGMRLRQVEVEELVTQEPGQLVMFSPDAM